MNNSSDKTFTRTVKSWIAYDAGNSAFATTVVAAFFPIFYLEFWASNLPKIEASIYLNWTLVICNVSILLSGPVIGAITDINQSTKKSLTIFTITSVFFVGLLYFLSVGSWIYALVFFGIANYCFCVAQIPYDKILTKISSPEKFSIISNQGYAWGYAGGGLLFIVNALMSIYPTSFGLASQSDAIRVSFLMVSVWWLLFLIPLLLNFQETRDHHKSEGIVLSSLKNIVTTLKSVYEYKNAFLFLIAFFLFIDGAHTVIYLASTFALNLGLETSSIIQALILVQLVAFPATLIWGYVANRFGDKLVLYITISSYIFIIIYSTTLSSALEFYLLAAWVGCVQGGIQGSSRGYFGKLIPKEKAGEFFGLYNVMGRAGAILGPLLVGSLLTLYGNVRIALLPIAILFIIGGLLLTRVKNEIA
ncbi:MAG: MFS transporter [Flavobacteriales bacterium]|nr:MFS transporter [Flavobacteriales bacterium]